jgi:hypothetical protein
VTGRWQRADLTKSWIRWLPCSFAYLTVVPDRHRFPRSAWESVLPWDAAVWCDPGDVEEWVLRAQRRYPRREADHAELHARDHYDRVVEVRAARIDLFAEMCRRQGLPVPHTLRELFNCLVGFGLFDVTPRAGGDTWVVPRLTLNPLDVLPLAEQESAAERRAQQDDRTVLAAIAVRELARRSRPRWRRRSVTTSLSALGARIGAPAEEVRRALTELSTVANLRVDAPTIAPDAALRITIGWPEFAEHFPFDDLPAPEHAV